MYRHVTTDIWFNGMEHTHTGTYSQIDVRIAILYLCYIAYMCKQLLYSNHIPHMEPH